MEPRSDPDNSKLVSGSYDNNVRVWDLATGDCLATLEVRKVPDIVE